tara:strand:+ start:99 stop:398 length:300 start_codon:yes stop_codon:yes gene_type:complete
MSIELIAISSFVVAILGGLGHFVNKSNLKSCKMCCIDSDCRDEDKSTDTKIKQNQERIDKLIKKMNELQKKKRMSNIAESPTISTSISEISNSLETTEI